MSTDNGLMYQTEETNALSIMLTIARSAPRAEIEQWCLDNIGPASKSSPWRLDIRGHAVWNSYDDMDVNDSWNIYSLFGRTRVSFRHAKDYQWFMLRWSE